VWACRNWYEVDRIRWGVEGRRGVGRDVGCIDEKLRVAVVGVEVQEEESRAREKDREVNNSCRSMMSYAIEGRICYICKSSTKGEVAERRHHHRI
jgi:hypothetical protein